ncbi:MAG: hypothetical protein QG657_1888 [Acidobacteriota bacterium]|nr:hypothetical protein [Acidobacteriota bacterium]
MSDNRNDINSLVIFPAFEVGYSELLHFLKSMEKNNLLNRFLLICPADFLNVHQFQVPYHIDDDFKSHAGLVRKIEAWAKLNRRTFIGIIGVDEEEQFNLSKRIARRFKLPFYHDRTCSTASNKYLLKTAFKEHGVLTGDFALLTGFDNTDIERVGFPFPNVLKVLSGNGSQYLFRNENIDQLKENYRILKTAVRGIKGDPRFRKQHVIINNQAVTLNPRRQFLLEAFITGEEFSCDFVICDGMVQVVRVVRKIKGSYFGYFKGYHLLNEKELGQYNIDLPRLKGLCERIARALAIETGQTGVSGVCGVCMVDFKVMNGEWYVLEASIRPGLSAFNHLMYEVYGYTSLFLMARQRLGMAIDIRFPQENGAVVYLYAQPGKKGEKIQSFDSPVLESLKKTFEIVHIHIYEEVGGGAVDLVTDHSALLRGYVILKNIDGEKLEELAELINKSFVGSRGTSRVFQKSPWLPEALINMNNIQQELTDICGERIDNTDPDYFKEAIDS